MEIRTETTAAADSDISIIPNGRNSSNRAPSSGLSVTFLAAAVAKTVTSSTHHLNECEAQLESLMQHHHQQQQQQEQQQQQQQPQRQHAEQQTQTSVKKCQTLVKYKNGKGGIGGGGGNGAGGTVKKRARFRIRRTSL